MIAKSPQGHPFLVDLEQGQWSRLDPEKATLVHSLENWKPFGDLWSQSGEWRGARFDAKGRLWARGTRKRGKLFELTKSEVREYFLTPTPTCFTWASNPEGELAMVSNMGVFRREADGWKLSRAFPTPWQSWFDTIQSGLFDLDGNLWITCNRARVVRVPPGGTPELLAQPLVDGPRLFCDSSGNLWITSLGGLFEIRRTAFRTVLPREGSSRVIGLNVRQDGTIWMSSSGARLYVKRESDAAPVFTDFKVGERGFAAALQGGVWAGLHTTTVKRIAQESPQGPARTVETHSFSGRITGIFESPTTGLWVSTTNGLFQRDGSGAFIEMTPPRNGSALTFMQDDAKGRLIMLQASGHLNRYNGKEWEHLFGPEEAPGDHVFHGLATTADDTIWLSGLSHLLVCVSEGEARVFEPPELDLPLHSVGLEADAEGGLWWSTYAEGIFYLDAHSAKELAHGKRRMAETQRFTVEDGLPSLACEGYHDTIFVDGKGQVWFPTAEGLTVIDPAAWKARRQRLPPLPVHVMSVLVDDQQLLDSASENALNLPKTIVVPQEGHRVEFRFGAISPTGSRGYQFQYQLEGIDADWIPAGGQRQAVYHDLRPGGYQFRVRANNAFGFSSEAPNTVSLAVLPAWWERPSVRLALLILVVGSGVWIHLRRLRQRESRRVLLENFSRQLLHTQETERHRIAGELHDSLGQNLLLIKATSELTAKKMDPQLPAQGKLKQMTAMADQSIDEVRAIVADLRPPMLDRLGLQAAVEVMMEQAEENTDILFDCDVAALKGRWDVDEKIHIFRLLQECLNNALKYAQAETIQIVAAEKGKKEIEIVFEDDGRGFVPEEKKRQAGGVGGLGLANLHERTRILGGRVEIDSTLGEGTRICFAIPYYASP